MRVPGSVLVVGSINVDLVVSVAQLPATGETVTGGAFAQYHGGKGANQAVAAARMGAAVTFVGAVGDDEFGRAALAEMAAEGIDVSRVVTLPGEATGVALIVVDAGGENQIAVASGANRRLDQQMVEEALAGAAVQPGGVFLANLEIGDEAVLAGARYAATAGMRIVINPAPARELPLEVLALDPILLPNQLEADVLTGEPEPLNAAASLAALTGAPVIVTLGAAGALVVADATVQWIAAPPVDVVDTTGAGDAFAGVFASEVARGTALLDAARVAVHAASMSVTARGARAGMPRRMDIE